MTGSIIASLSELSPVTPWDEAGEDLKKKAFFTGNPPVCTVYPDSADILTKIVKLANENRWKLVITGNGSKLDWGKPVNSPDIVVGTRGLNKIIEHATGDLTVTVEAGITLKELQERIAPTRQFLPLDPGYADRSTIGGIMATADAGPWRQRYGGVRDLILGFSFIRHDGEIARAGGRVVKNVAGYDLMKLFTGSYGTLGIITEVTLRLYPMVEDSRTLLVTGDLNPIVNLAAIIRKSGLTPTVAEILTADTVKELGIGERTALLLRFESIPESAGEQSRQIESLAGELNCRVLEYREKDEDSLWLEYRKIMDNPGQEGTVLGKIGVVPSALESLFGKIAGTGSINIANGIGKIRLQPGTKIENIRSLCESHRGYLSVLEAPPAIKEKIDVWGYRGNALTVMNGLKTRFDPHCIFNPDRFI